MNNRERAMAVLNYQNYDRLPIVHFGFWTETLEKWAAEGHVSEYEAHHIGDGNPIDMAVGRRLGFDFNWLRAFGAYSDIMPAFETKVVEVMPDGSRKVMDNYGVTVLQKDNATGIPSELDHLFKGRKEWDEFFKPKLNFTPDRINLSEEMLTELRQTDREEIIGLYCGSLYGTIRCWTGMVGLAYIQADDPKLYEEMIETMAELCYQGVKAMLAILGAHYDFGHFWEDICFKNGPLVRPQVFYSKVGPGYRRITDLLHSHGINLVSLDCDGKIDALIPTWLDHGVNVMFPIEVGTWEASIKPWREKYGQQIRGVGGMDKRVFAYDQKAVDAEIERLKPLDELGGFIPCPDHRIPPNAQWETVQYYCERMQKVFG
jgi:hypothetical protein